MTEGELDYEIDRIRKANRADKTAFEKALDDKLLLEFAIERRAVEKRRQDETTSAAFTRLLSTDAEMKHLYGDLDRAVARISGY